MTKQKKFIELFGEIHGEKNKRIPKDFQDVVVKQPLIANKQFYFYTTFDQQLLVESRLMKKVLESYKVAQPMSQFLSAALKGV